MKRMNKWKNQTNGNTPNTYSEQFRFVECLNDTYADDNVRARTPSEAKKKEGFLTSFTNKQGRYI